MLTHALLALNAVLIATALALLVALLRRRGGVDPVELDRRLGEATQELARIERAVRDEIGRNREEASLAARHAREEMGAGLREFNESMIRSLGDMASGHKGQLDSFARQLHALTQASEARLEALRLAGEKSSEALRATVDRRLADIQAASERKLEQMRATVDEKLHATLEQRLGESFRLVSERLEQVHRGLGEMQGLASGVGDLKRVLTNVTARGAFGELQLSRLLEQIFAPDQYEANISPNPRRSERVEFAIRLPGQEDRPGAPPVWLPIDSKFPQEDYLRLIDAQARGDAEAAERAAQDLEKRLQRFARDIRDKYIDPPHTTDFAILFLPTEGLYAEALRRGGLFELLQRDYRVTLAGPTTLAALLNALQMGFRTLAIQKRSGEVWKLLGAVKSQFGKFGELLENVKKRLDQASSEIDKASQRQRIITQRLGKVEELPSSEALALLPEPEADPGFVSNSFDPEDA